MILSDPSQAGDMLRGKKKRTHALAALALACGEEDSEVFQDGFKTPNASFEGAPWGMEPS